MAAGKWVWLSIALVGAILSLGWPMIEHQLAASGVKCPWPFNSFHHSPASAPIQAERDAAAAAGEELPVSKLYTLEELKKYDGSDESLPILLAVGGKVLDVTSGAKFYGVGKTYHQFAGTACTRALALSSLKKKDISDDVSDFNEKQNKELVEIKAFYYDKYPTVGVLA